MPADPGPCIAHAPPRHPPGTPTLTVHLDEHTRLPELFARTHRDQGPVHFLLWTHAALQTHRDPHRHGQTADGHSGRDPRKVGQEGVSVPVSSSAGPALVSSGA